MRTITIEFADGKGFTVREGERYCDYLAWDEMLGTIAQLTHSKIGTSHYSMNTAEEHAAIEAARQERISAARQADPDRAEISKPPF